MFVVEEKQQQEQHQALPKISVTQDPTEQQHVHFMEKLQDKLNKGTLIGLWHNITFLNGVTRTW